MRSGDAIAATLIPHDPGPEADFLTCWLGHDSPEEDSADGGRRANLALSYRHERRRAANRRAQARPKLLVDFLAAKEPHGPPRFLLDDSRLNRLGLAAIHANQRFAELKFDQRNMLECWTNAQAP